MLDHMPAINDACERVLGMTTDIENRASAPRSDEEMANLIKLTLTNVYRSELRKRVKLALNGKKLDTTTKQFLQIFQW